MGWSHDQIETLIELYKQNPCLYHVKNPLYHNKHARSQALEHIKAEMVILGAAWVTIKDLKVNIITYVRIFYLNTQIYELN